MLCGIPCMLPTHKATMATILIMDDEDKVRNFLIQLLQLEGHAPVAYPDAAPALDEVDLSAIDLVITDMAMPTRGELAIGAIRATGSTMPIIAMSGSFHANDEKHLLSLGAQRFLSKPFELDILLDMINQLLPAGDTG